MKILSITALVLTIIAAGLEANAQGNPASGPAPHPGAAAPPTRPMGQMPMHHQSGGMIGPHPGQQSSPPIESGQAAFAAIQEIVAVLQADSRTDWSNVDVDALRQHLIDMDQVTMQATVRKEPVDGGLRMTVTGSGRTLEAIQRMVPDHAREISGMNGWVVSTTLIPNGVELTTTAANPTEAQKIRGLGFMGIMAQGGHHQPHHLAMAKGEPLHRH